MSGHKKFTDEQVEDLRERVACGEPQAAIARELGMSARYAWTLATGGKRRDAGGPLHVPRQYHTGESR